MRTARNVDRLTHIIRNAKVQILMAEQHHNFDRAYSIAKKAINETELLINALNNYAQSKLKEVQPR